MSMDCQQEEDMSRFDAMLQSRDMKYFLMIERCTYLFNLKIIALILIHQITFSFYHYVLI